MLSAMTEWLMLSLLVPAFVAPAVMLLGFSGCTLDTEGVPGDPNEPPGEVQRYIVRDDLGG